VTATGDGRLVARSAAGKNAQADQVILLFSDDALLVLSGSTSRIVAAPEA
jgi:hypothetical protein